MVTFFLVYNIVFTSLHLIPPDKIDSQCNNFKRCLSLCIMLGLSLWGYSWKPGVFVGHLSILQQGLWVGKSSVRATIMSLLCPSVTRQTSKVSCPFPYLFNVLFDSIFEVSPSLIKFLIWSLEFLLLSICLSIACCITWSFSASAFYSSLYSEFSYIKNAGLFTGIHEFCWALLCLWSLCGPKIGGGRGAKVIHWYLKQNLANVITV